MKAIIKTFSTQDCEKIFNGEMTVIACKPAPKIEPPFKVYVYESIGQGEGAGAVVGEFVCYGIDKLVCLSYQEMIEYFYKPEELDGKNGKSWDSIAYHQTETLRHAESVVRF